MAEPVPTWAGEVVLLAEPDPAWSAEGRRAAAELTVALAVWLGGPVEHIGSTAVPGLRAKPILDLAAPVLDLDCADAVSHVLHPSGWHFVPPDLDLRPDRRFYVEVVDGHRSKHLQLVVAGSARHSAAIGFRDALRADQQLRSAYSDLKERLAAQHGPDREAYTEAKGAFVRNVLAHRSQA